MRQTPHYSQLAQTGPGAVPDGVADHDLALLEVWALYLCFGGDITLVLRLSSLKHFLLASHTKNIIAKTQQMLHCKRKLVWTQAYNVGSSPQPYRNQDTHLLCKNSKNSACASLCVSRDYWWICQRDDETCPSPLFITLLSFPPTLPLITLYVHHSLLYLHYTSQPPSLN